MSEPLDWDRDGRHWPHREASRFVTSGGIRWHVQVMGCEPGTAPVLLLLHGTGASTHSWRGVMPALADRYTLVAPDLPDTFEALTPREREVVYLLAQGHSRQQTAAICTISVHTVSDYAKSAYRKLGVHNRAQVAALIYHGDAAP